MKHVKKLASLLLALVMVLGLATTAFAAGNDGSITISNATVGETYAVYKVFDLTYKGEAVAYSYTKTGESDALYTALASDASPFTLTATTTANVYNVALKADITAADVSAFLKANEANLTKTAESVEVTTNEVKFENLPYGYYYITSSLGTVVTIDSAKKDVTVIDKNQGPSWDNEPGEDDETGEDTNPGKVIIEDGVKKVVNSANYGDTVNFSIAVNATAYVGDRLVTNYYITDTLADGFSSASNIVVKVGDQTLTADDYVLTQNGNTFEITIPFGTKYGSNAKIEVTYTATVLDTAAIAGEGNLNTANFTYATTPADNPGTDPDDPQPGDGDKKDYEDSNKKTTTTYVYALGIKKVDPKGNALTGAEFSVTDENGNAIYAAPTTEAGVYEYSDENNQDDVKQFKTNDDGILIIKGLEAGKYTIKEEVAPAGYNLLTYTVDVTAEIAETSSYTTTITTYYDANGNVVSVDEYVSSVETTVETNVVPVVVVNYAGTELPSTGGMGTTLFYVIGGLLVVAAAVLLITKKRMSQAER